MKKISILGTRGIPAQHGGFETFAEYLAPYLVKHNWDVTVYCQDEGAGDIYEGSWNGVRLIHIPIKQTGSFGTLLFDWKSTLHAAKQKNLILTLGYNTAVFGIVYRLKTIKNIINMDGIEWKRAKWPLLERSWFYLNEHAGSWLGNHLIADHPEMENHLKTYFNKNKITTIPYCADVVETADRLLLKKLGLTPNEYAVIIARPEPENSILEIVKAFSRKKRNKKLVVLGNFDKAIQDYRKQVFNAASDEVIFPGAIYNKSMIEALRFFTTLYIHGHQVGGTNPSLVEALSAGSPVLAHDNKFNRWVAGPENHYFNDEAHCASKLDEILTNPESQKTMRSANFQRHSKLFTCEIVLGQYEKLLRKQLMM